MVVLTIQVTQVHVDSGMTLVSWLQETVALLVGGQVIVNIMISMVTTITATMILKRKLMQDNYKLVKCTDF